MLNVLYEKFPEHVIVHGIRYPIETDFRNGSDSPNWWKTILYRGR